MSGKIFFLLLLGVGVVLTEDTNELGYTDLIPELGLPQLPSGIAEVTGMCGNSERTRYQTHTAPAYRISKEAILTAQTSQIFVKSFPVDFSILLTVRANRTNQAKAPIFTIYSDESEEVLSLRLGREISLNYEQIDATFAQRNDINFGIGFADTQWHRLGISVKGNVATLVLDCTKQVTRHLERTRGSTISTKGLILTGVQMIHEHGFFIGDVQLLAISDRSNAAYEVCTKYATPCNEQNLPGTKVKRRRKKGPKLERLAASLDSLQAVEEYNDGDITDTTFGSGGIVSHQFPPTVSSKFNVDADVDVVDNGLQKELEMGGSDFESSTVLPRGRGAAGAVEDEAYNSTNVHVGNVLCHPGSRGYTGGTGQQDECGPKAEQGKDGLDVTLGTQRPPAHEFDIPAPIQSGKEKGPDSQVEALNSSVTQHMADEDYATFDEGPNAEDVFNELMGINNSPPEQKQLNKTRKRKKSHRKKPQAADDGKMSDLYGVIYKMRQEIDKLRNPTGTQDNPVRSCRDLYFSHPQFADGWYWIDPNAGMPDDAIHVYCNMTAKGETCLYPDVHTAEMPVLPWQHTIAAANVDNWYSQLKGASRIAYDGVGAVQMTFLRLLSREAHQNVTYSCQHSTAWYSQTKKSFGQALKFLGDNEMEIAYNGAAVEIEALRDECQVGHTITLNSH